MRLRRGTQAMAVVCAWLGWGQDFSVIVCMQRLLRRSHSLMTLSEDMLITCTPAQALLVKNTQLSSNPDSTLLAEPGVTQAAKMPRRMALNGTRNVTPVGYHWDISPHSSSDPDLHLPLAACASATDRACCEAVWMDTVDASSQSDW